MYVQGLSLKAGKPVGDDLELLTNGFEVVQALVTERDERNLG